MRNLRKAALSALGTAIALAIVVILVVGGLALVWKITTNVRVRIMGGTMVVKIETGEEVMSATWKSGWLWSNPWYLVKKKDGTFEFREESLFLNGKVEFKK